MRVLLLDIESAPTIAGIWRLYDDYVSTDQILKGGYVLCVSAKWLGEKGVMFFSEWKDGKRKMLDQIHKLMDEADVVIHYNGIKYDIPTLNREFITDKMPPPAPFKQIDLLPTVKRKFKFVSNKLDYVCQHLGLGRKVKHKGMQLWWDCMTGKAPAQRTMQRYNIRDVLLLEKLYYKLRPWISNHPLMTVKLSATGKSIACPRCASTRIHSRGYTTGAAGTVFRKFQCMKCMGWFKGEREKVSPTVERPLS